MSARDIWTPPSVNVWNVDKVEVEVAATQPRVKLIRRASPTTIALRAACWRLGIETRTTAQDRETYLAHIAAQRQQTRAQLVQMKKASKAISAQRDAKSMMHAGHPAYMRTTAQRDERTKRLFAAHERRQQAGWIRG